jgi:hypothetical protein
MAAALGALIALPGPASMPQPPARLLTTRRALAALEATVTQLEALTVALRLEGAWMETHGDIA